MRGNYSKGYLSCQHDFELVKSMDPDQPQDVTVTIFQPQVLEDSMGYKLNIFPQKHLQLCHFQPPKTNSTKNQTHNPHNHLFFGFPSFTHTFRIFYPAKKMACFHLEIFLRLVRPYYRGAPDGRHIFALATRPFPSQWQFFRRHRADVVWALKIKIHLGHKWSFDDNMVTRAKKRNFDHLFVDYLYPFMGFGQEENWNSWRISPFGLAKLWSFGRTWHRNYPTIPDLPGRFFGATHLRANGIGSASAGCFLMFRERC